jgi:hypothetical protein
MGTCWNSLKQAYKWKWLEKMLSGHFFVLVFWRAIRGCRVQNKCQQALFPLFNSGNGSKPFNGIIAAIKSPPAHGQPSPQFSPYPFQISLLPAADAKLGKAALKAPFPSRNR